MKTHAMTTLTISLSSKQLLTLQEAVDTGAYASNSEVVREALRQWEDRRYREALDLQRLKRAYDDGIASGPGREVDPATLLGELKAETRRG